MLQTIKILRFTAPHNVEKFVASYKTTLLIYNQIHFLFFLGKLE